MLDAMSLTDDQHEKVLTVATERQSEELSYRATRAAIKRLLGREARITRRRGPGGAVGKGTSRGTGFAYVAEEEEEDGQPEEEELPGEEEEHHEEAEEEGITWEDEEGNLLWAADGGEGTQVFIATGPRKKPVWRPHKPAKGKAKGARKGGGKPQQAKGPSAKRPCTNCGSPAHWIADCDKEIRADLREEYEKRVALKKERKGAPGGKKGGGKKGKTNLLTEALLTTVVAATFGAGRGQMATEAVLEGPPPLRAGWKEQWDDCLIGRPNEEGIQWDSRPAHVLWTSGGDLGQGIAVVRVEGILDGACTSSVSGLACYRRLAALKRKQPKGD